MNYSNWPNGDWETAQTTVRKEAIVTRRLRMSGRREQRVTPFIPGTNVAVYYAPRRSLKWLFAFEQAVGRKFLRPPAWLTGAM